MIFVQWHKQRGEREIFCWWSRGCCGQKRYFFGVANLLTGARRDFCTAAQATRWKKNILLVEPCWLWSIRVFFGVVRLVLMVPRLRKRKPRFFSFSWACAFHDLMGNENESLSLISRDPIVFPVPKGSGRWAAFWCGRSATMETMGLFGPNYKDMSKERNKNWH